MNQYQRIISYLYEYAQEEKGENAGYVRLENRGRQCRIQVQMCRKGPAGQAGVYLFQQQEEGLDCLRIGSLTEKNGGLFCRVEMEAEDLLGSGFSLAEMDGLLIHSGKDPYFATTWKNERVYLGKWKEIFGKSVSDVLQERKEENEPQKVEDPERREPVERVDPVAVEKEDIPETSEKCKETTTPESSPEHKEAEERKIVQEQEEELRAQSVCGNCPFKRQMLDYGKRILLSFPGMRPFTDDRAKSCVRIEPQDIGCLPMQMWSLSNNRFLLQGYYSYRHLIFAETESKKYAIGIPGIYSERDKNNANRFGFREFWPISSEENRTGAFGYWMMTLPGIAKNNGI